MEQRINDTIQSLPESITVKVNGIDNKVPIIYINALLILVRTNFIKDNKPYFPSIWNPKNWSLYLYTAKRVFEIVFGIIESLEKKK